jgi:flagellar protein FlbD
MDESPFCAEVSMISVTRLKGQVVALNPDMIESVEENPDTTIRLTSGEKLLVRESLEQVVELVASYRRYLLSALSVQPLSGGFSRHPSQIPAMGEKE